jgi:hypothetical protein
MKKLLVAVVALSTVSAFAGKSMVRLDGCFDGQCDSLDFGSSTSKAGASGSKEVKKQTINLNYAYAFTDTFGAGLTYKSKNNTTGGDVMAAGDEATTTGISLYWNKDGMWSDSCFAALHYDMIDNKDSKGAKDGSEGTNITLEYGHRYSLGNLMGVNWNWAPSATYAMGTSKGNASGSKDDKTTALALNVANFAVSF